MSQPHARNFLFFVPTLLALAIGVFIGRASVELGQGDKQLREENSRLEISNKSLNNQMRRMNGDVERVIEERSLAEQAANSVGASALLQSMRNLRQVGIAFQKYHDAYKAFPVAEGAHADGEPRASWRVLLLDFVYARAVDYDFSAPWDDPRNHEARQAQVPEYQNPRGREVGTNRTSYVVVVSPDSHRIAVVEIRNSNIEWAEPRDIDLDSLSTDPMAPNSIDLAAGAVVLSADASVKTLTPGTSLETLKATLAEQGGTVGNETAR